MMVIKPHMLLKFLFYCTFAWITAYDFRAYLIEVRRQLFQRLCSRV